MLPLLSVVSEGNRRSTSFAVPAWLSMEPCTEATSASFFSRIAGRFARTVTSANCVDSGLSVTVTPGRASTVSVSYPTKEIFRKARFVMPPSKVKSPCASVIVPVTSAESGSAYSATLANSMGWFCVSTTRPVNCCA